VRQAGPRIKARFRSAFDADCNFRFGVGVSRVFVSSTATAVSAANVKGVVSKQV